MTDPTFFIDSLSSREDEEPHFRIRFQDNFCLYAIDELELMYKNARFTGGALQIHCTEHGWQEMDECFQCTLCEFIQGSVSVSGIG
jgi:hypothetical protein